jgi:hypothetical protein
MLETVSKSGNQTVLHEVGGGTAADAWLNTTYDSYYHLFPTQPQQAPTTYAETAQYYGVNGLALSDAKAFWDALQAH